MGKLNIAHHKSYHPYRRDNIEKVRKDEEEARLKEENEEGRMRLADSEARIDLLRQRAGGPKGRKISEKEADLESQLSGVVVTAPDSASVAAIAESLTASTGHINLFASLEAAVATQASLAASSALLQQRKAKGKEDEEGVRLAPSKRDLQPWYTDEDLKGGKEREQGEEEREVRRMKDLGRKNTSDPLREMNTLLAQRARARASGGRAVPFRLAVHRPPASTPSSLPNSTTPNSALASRLARETAERQRALELIARKKRETMSVGTESVMGTPGRRGYEDAYNWDATREAAERRRGWGRDRGRESNHDRRRDTRW